MPSTKSPQHAHTASFRRQLIQAGNMQATQSAAIQAGFTWVQVNSTNPNHQDYKTPKDMAAWNDQMKAMAEIKAGKPVSEPETTPYGCSIKY